MKEKLGSFYDINNEIIKQENQKILIGKTAASLIEEDDIIIIDKNEIEHYDDINNLNYISVLNITKENIQKKNKTSSKIELIDKKVIVKINNLITLEIMCYTTLI